MRIVPLRCISATVIFTLGVAAFTAGGCGREKTPAARPNAKPPGDAAPAPAPLHKGFRHIKSMNDFEKVISLSGKELLVFDLYADWCMPCKILAPLLDSIARQYADRALFYKVDTEAHPTIAQLFGIRGIPHVAFVKDSTAVYSLTGIRPREHYAQVIEKFSPVPAKPDSAARLSKL